MTPESEKSMEDLLRGCAQKRREEAGAPIELHPVTRQMLQDEVARTFAKPPPPADSRFAFLKLIWRRLAFAGAMTAALLTVVVVLQTQKSTREELALARKNSNPDFIVVPAERAAVDKDGEGFGRRAEPTELSIRAKLETASGTAPTPSPKPSALRSDSVTLEQRLESVTLDDGKKPAAPAPVMRKNLAADKTGSAGGGGFGGGVAGGAAATSGRVGATAGDDLARSSALGAARELREENEKRKAGDVSGLADATRPAAPSAPRVVLDRRAGEPNVKLDGVGALTDSPAAGAKQDQSRVARLAKADPARRPGAADAKGFDAGGVPMPPPPPAATSTGRRLAEKESRPAENAGKTVAFYNIQNAPAAAEKPASIALNYSDAFKQQSTGFGVQGEGLRQRFYSLDSRAKYRVNLNSPPVPKVLTVFDVEHAGNQVRIVDADGSTYDGQFGENAESGAYAESDVRVQREGLQEKVKDQAQKRMAWAAASRDESAGVRFRAAGTNRTLNQLVVLEGNFVADTGAPPLAAVAPAPVAQTRLALRGVVATNTMTVTAAGAAAVGGPAAAPAQGNVLDELQKLPNLRMLGRALVGGTNEFRIEAVPQK